MPGVFISYRRSDASGEARSIYDRIRTHPSKPKVFLDVEAIKTGDLWQDSIDNALAQCDVMLVVIGPNWLTIASGAAKARLFDEEDRVAYEVCAALKRQGVRVVPLRVDGAALPTRAQLPEKLAGLLDSQDFEIRNRAFERDYRALEEDILGPRKPVAMIVATVVGVAALAMGTWAFMQPDRTPSQPPATASQAGPNPPAAASPPSSEPGVAQAGTTASGSPPAASRNVDLKVEVAFSPHPMLSQIGPPLAGLRLILDNPEPRRGPYLLDASPPTDQLPLRFAQDGVMPLRTRTTFSGTLVRHMVRAARVTAGNEGVVATHVCFRLADATPTSTASLQLQCNEGVSCAPGGDSGLVSSCGTKTVKSGWMWSDLIPSALAQPAPAKGADRPAPGDWLVPQLKALSDQARKPGAAAYSELTLKISPLPQEPAAQEISYEVAINGRRLWVDGLPAWTHAVPFQPGQTAELAFGLENLDSSGVNDGRERLDVRILLLKDKRPVAEDRVSLDFVALRDMDAQAAVTEAGRAVRWSAHYVPAPGDRFQIFASSGGKQGTLANKKKFDGTRVLSASAPEAPPLVGVVRPPLKNNPSWGMAVGESLPNGQVRFTFDREEAARLCASMIDAQVVRKFRSAGFDSPSFRVREIARQPSSNALSQGTTECAAFRPGARSTS